MIFPGVTIGDRVLIRPFSTVTQDIPDRSLVDRDNIKHGVLTDALISRMTRSHIANQ